MKADHRALIWEEVFSAWRRVVPDYAMKDVFADVHFQWSGRTPSLLGDVGWWARDQFRASLARTERNPIWVETLKGSAETATLLLAAEGNPDAMSAIFVSAHTTALLGRGGRFPDSWCGPAHEVITQVQRTARAHLKSLNIEPGWTSPMTGIFPNVGLPRGLRASLTPTTPDAYVELVAFQTLGLLATLQLVRIVLDTPSPQG